MFGMTPGVRAVKKAKVDFKLHEYKHDPRHESFGMEAVEKLNLDALRVFKTLVVETSENDLAVAVLPVSLPLNMKMMATALGVKKVSMADKTRVETVTGYVLGGVSPLGQKRRLPTVVHATVETCETMFFSGGRRGLEIELAPADFVLLTRAKIAPICS